MNDRIRDMSPLVDMTDGREIGPTRTAHPVYVDLLPPCNNACPAGEDIQAWLGLAQAGKYREAWETLVRDNPMPAVHGRVCYHPCESACNRGALDSPVGVHAVERFLGDLAAQEGWTFKAGAAPSGRRVLVVGGGPGGLSAA
jgi:NADPH-dependent glutamate synthase beta subunit-like oxidoreductase